MSVCDVYCFLKKILSSAQINSLENLFLRENHLKENISRLEVDQTFTRHFRSSCFKHTIDFLIFVKNRKLWESPRTYIWKHLGQMEWKKENGTKVTFARIHVK